MKWNNCNKKIRNLKIKLQVFRVRIQNLQIKLLNYSLKFKNWPNQKMEKFKNFKMKSKKCKMRNHKLRARVKVIHRSKSNWSKKSKRLKMKLPRKMRKQNLMRESSRSNKTLFKPKLRRFKNCLMLIKLKKKILQLSNPKLTLTQRQLKTWTTIQPQVKKVSKQCKILSRQRMMSWP